MLCIVGAEPHVHDISPTNDTFINTSCLVAHHRANYGMSCRLTGRMMTVPRIVSDVLTSTQETASLIALLFFWRWCVCVTHTNPAVATPEPTASMSVVLDEVQDLCVV